MCPAVVSAHRRGVRCSGWERLLSRIYNDGTRRYVDVFGEEVVLVFGRVMNMKIGSRIVYSSGLMETLAPPSLRGDQPDTGTGSATG